MLAELGALKPFLKIWLLPPVPGLLIIVAGAWCVRRRPGWGRGLLGLGVLLAWLSCTQGLAVCLQDQFLRPPPAVNVSQLRPQADQDGAAAILVLGGGFVPHAPEYGRMDLSQPSAERLRYGVWLHRQTGWPLGFSGGRGWAQRDSAGGGTEADAAVLVAALMYGVDLRWVERKSADTRENAGRSVALLAAQGVRHIVLVTDAWHMPRAQRAFEEASRRWGQEAPTITAAPMAYWQADSDGLLDWMPSGEGFRRVRWALHELLGLWVGA